MTTPTQTPPSQTAPTSKGMTKSDFEMLLEKDVKTSVWIEPFGAQPGEEIKLSVPLIRRYVAVPAWDREEKKEIQPSDEECVKFLMLCNARRLNPFEGDAYMIPFFDKSRGRHAWSLITAHSAFLKRAELHPHYDGMESGIIVQRGDQVLDLPGDFRLDTDKLLGGWSIVHNKNHSHPSVKRVKLSTYVKGFGVWTQDPEGMICKVAEAQNVRDSFPTLIGGMYLREEIESEDFQRLVNQEVKKPKIDPTLAPIPPGTQVVVPAETVVRTAQGVQPVKRNKRTLVDEPLDQKPVEVQAEPATNPVAVPPTAVPSAPPPTNETPEAALLRELLTLAKESNISDEQLIKFLLHPKQRWLKAPQSKINELSGTKLTLLTKAWKENRDEFTKRVMGHQQ